MDAISWECLPGVLTAIPNSSHWDNFHPVLILDICRVCSGRRHTNWPCSGLSTSAWPSVWQLRQLALLLVWPFTMNYVAVLPVTCPLCPIQPMSRTSVQCTMYVSCLLSLSCPPHPLWTVPAYHMALYLPCEPLLFQRSPACCCAQGAPSSDEYWLMFCSAVPGSLISVCFCVEHYILSFRLNVQK